MKFSLISAFARRLLHRGKNNNSSEEIACAENSAKSLANSDKSKAQTSQDCNLKIELKSSHNSETMTTSLSNRKAKSHIPISKISAPMNVAIELRQGNDVKDQSSSSKWIYRSNQNLTDLNKTETEDDDEESDDCALNGEYSTISDSYKTYKSRQTMPYDENHIRHILLFEYHLHGNAAKATDKIFSVYPNTVTELQCQRWFKKFREGNFNLEDEPRCWQPRQVNDDRARIMFESNPRPFSAKKEERTKNGPTVACFQDEPRCGRPGQVNDDRARMMFESNPRPFSAKKEERTKYGPTVACFQDEPRFGWPRQVNDNQVRMMFESNPRPFSAKKEERTKNRSTVACFRKRVLSYSNRVWLSGRYHL